MNDRFQILGQNLIGGTVVADRRPNRPHSTRRDTAYVRPRFLARALRLCDDPESCLTDVIALAEERERQCQRKRQHRQIVMNRRRSRRSAFPFPFAIPAASQTLAQKASATRPLFINYDNDLHDWDVSPFCYDQISEGQLTVAFALHGTLSLREGITPAVTL